MRNTTRLPGRRYQRAPWPDRDGGRARSGRACLTARTTTGTARRTMLATIALLAVAGCTTAPDDTGRASGTTMPRLVIPAGPPATAPPTMPLPEGYEAPDTRFVTLTPVTGLEAPAAPDPGVPMSGGTSRIAGAIAGPGGPAVGALVRIERFVDDRVGVLDLTTGPDGRYDASGLPGGRFRVRAFQPPILTVTKPIVLFLAAANGDQTVDLVLERRNFTEMQASGSSGRWRVGQSATVAAQLTQEYVDPDGIVRSGPVVGSLVTVQVNRGVDVVGDASRETGADGSVRFTVACTDPGNKAATVVAGGFTRNVPLPECIEEQPPPVVTPFDVGDAFTTPAAGPYPPGTYTAFNGDLDTCATTYESYVDGQWVRAGGQATLRPSHIFRNLTPAAGTAPCAYRRTA